MLDVRELLRRRAAGHSVRAVARTKVADRKTVRRYFEAADELGVAHDAELSEEVVARIGERVQARAKPSRSPEWLSLEGARARIEAWLGADLRLTRVHELLGEDGVRVGYTTLRRFAHEELGWRERRSSVRVDDPAPGDEAQIDFGLMGYVVDAEGRRRKLWALIVTLSHSRYAFVWPTFVQTVPAVCEALDAAWRFFGGVPRWLVPDNMSSVVTRASATAPVLNPAFAEYAESRGTFVDPARVRRPQDKARVENHVPYVRERWFAGRDFGSPFDIAAARTSAAAWCRDVAGARIHGTTRAVPREVFEAIEQPKLLAAPTTPFDVPVWKEGTAQSDHHVQVARALYSVPTRVIGKKLQVRVDSSTVRLYAGLELVKVHPRVGPGKRSTDPADYPIGKAEYATRSVDGTRPERSHAESTSAPTPGAFSRARCHGRRCARRTRSSRSVNASAMRRSMPCARARSPST